MISKFLLTATLLACAMPALAEEAVVAPPPKKISTLVVYGEDSCPRSNDDEIIVCSRQPESERYRIPEKLRHAKKKAKDRSWGDRVQSLEMVSATGRPNSCSPVGANGQSGCMTQFLRQAREEREQKAQGGE